VNVGALGGDELPLDTGVVEFKTLHDLRGYCGDVETTEPLPFGVHAGVLRRRRPCSTFGP
jgi:hypothetical protein